MLDPKLTEKIALAYVAIGDIGHSIALNSMKGKDHSNRQKELKDRGRKLQLYMKILLRHVDASTTPPTLYRITDEQVNKLIRCIEKIGQIDSYPIVPSLLPTPRPILLNRGLDGTDGEDGAPGSDANIVCEPDTDETQISITEVDVDGVKTYKFKFTPYEEPTISVDLDGSEVVEEGVVVASHNLNITTHKGSKNITALTITNDSVLNAALQAILNLATLNGGTQPVLTVLPNTNISANKDYIVEVTDSSEEATAEDSIRFYYPFLYGATDTTSPTHYSALTKLIEALGDKELILNGANKYFWIGFPSSYGSAARIKDQNGFVVTDAFTEVLVDVTSTGLDNNWTVEYRFYRTTLKTDINNQPYTIEF